MKPVNFVTVAAFAAFTLPALGQTSSTPRIDQRQANQEWRIEQGEKSGALTNKEAARLEKDDSTGCSGAPRQSSLAMPATASPVAR